MVQKQSKNNLRCFLAAFPLNLREDPHWFFLTLQALKILLYNLLKASISNVHSPFLPLSRLIFLQPLQFRT